MHPDAVRVLRDTIGIDVSQQRPQHLDTVIGRRFDHVITLCDRAREAALASSTPCGGRTGASPIRPRPRRFRAFRRVAADIDSRIRHLLPVITATDRSEGPP